MRTLFLSLLLTLSFVARAESPQSTREAFLKLIDRPRVDPAPKEEQRTPPSPDFTLTHVVFNTEPTQHVPALFLKSASAKADAKLPVVILLHGTGGHKEDNLGLMKTFAAKGFLAVAPDGRYHGERCAKGRGTDDYYPAIAQAYHDGKSHPWLYDTVYDVMRLIDYLQTRPDVDPRRIGLMGFSKGGMETYLASAADPRIAVSIPCIGVQSYKWELDNNQWKGRIATVQGAADMVAKSEGVKIDTAFVQRFYDHVVPGVYGPFDGPAMLPLIAPRPLLVINGDSDVHTPLPSVMLAADAAKAAYEKAGVPDRFVLKIEKNTAHKVDKESTEQAIAWFVKWLKPTE